MDLDAYLERVVALVSERLGDDLHAVTLIGSAAAGDYRPESSDVDVAVVIEGALGAERAREIAAALAHRRLPCPARKLELVVYRRDVVARPGRHVPFELDLNTGAGMEDHVGLDPAAEADHWFVLDLVGARATGRSLLGPPPEEVLGEVPRAAVLDALLASLRWFAADEPAGPGRVLAACRAALYAAEGRWASKDEAARWAAERLDAAVPVEWALAARRGAAGVPPAPGVIDALAERAAGLVAAG
jgi:hypothetical protein